MPRGRKRISRAEAWDVARWLHRHFENVGHNRALLRQLDGILQGLQLRRREVQEQAVADLQVLVDDLPAAIWAKCGAYLRMKAARERDDLVSIKVPRELKRRLADYQHRQGLSSVVATLEHLLDAC